MSKVLVRYEPTPDNRNRVVGFHYRPDTLTQAQIDASPSLIVDKSSLPTSAAGPMQQSTLYVNPNVTPASFTFEYTAKRPMTRVEFRRLLTFDERKRLTKGTKDMNGNALSDDDQIALKVMLDDLLSAEEIDIQENETVQMVQWLELKSLIGVGRTDAILSGTSP